MRACNQAQFGPCSSVDQLLSPFPPPPIFHTCVYRGVRGVVCRENSEPIIYFLCSVILRNLIFACILCPESRSSKPEVVRCELGHGTCQMSHFLRAGVLVGQGTESYSSQSGGWKAGPLSLSLACRRAVSPRVLMWSSLCVSVPTPSSYKDTGLTGSGPTRVVSFYLYHLF